ncbi:MAG: hypothetical protein OXH57_13220 [Ekhidna sp.]|nr:hypothetical protein [Ekhidna sp.]
MRQYENRLSFKETKWEAEQGYTYAQFALGVMYYDGYGTLKDPQIAA